MTSMKDNDITKIFSSHWRRKRKAKFLISHAQCLFFWRICSAIATTFLPWAFGWKLVHFYWLITYFGKRRLPYSKRTPPSRDTPLIMIVLETNASMKHTVILSPGILSLLVTVAIYHRHKIQQNGFTNINVVGKHILKRQNHNILNPRVSCIISFP